MKKWFAFSLCVAFLLSFTAVGSAVSFAGEVSAAADAAVVEVSTVNELLDAIKPGASIRLASGTYNLTKAKGYGGKYLSDHYYWQSMGDGSSYALVIEDVAGLTICGTEGTEIISECRTANVLGFNHCSGLTLKNIRAGHTEQAEACEGGVIRLETCDNATIENCDLYGCGTIGIDAYQCWNLTVADTSIHHCSSSAVSLSSGKHALIRGCSISDCGQGDYSAWSCFNLWDTADVRIESCSVVNNRFSNLIGGSFDGDSVTVGNMEVTGNRIDSFFGFDGRLEINGLTLAENTVNKWYDAWNAPKIVIDGKTFGEENLNEAFGSQLSANGIGKVEVPQTAIDTSSAAVVHVSTADEFISAIASDTLIIIDAEEIDLSTAACYGSGAVEFWDFPENSSFGKSNTLWQQVFDGYALWIGNVSNLHIRGGKIITSPRYANILSFYLCDNVSVDGTTLGHTEGSECAGGVVYLYGCSDVILESCDLYGCGIYGVQTVLSNGLRVQNTCIHDCSYGAAVFSDSGDVVCLNTTVINCPSPEITVENCENFVWDDMMMGKDLSFDPSLR